MGTHPLVYGKLRFVGSHDVFDLLAVVTKDGGRCHSQAEVTYLGNPIGDEPHVAWFEVPVDYVPGVSELEATTGGPRYLHGLFHGDTVLGGVLHQTLNIAAAHEFGDHEAARLVGPGRTR